jgi:tRNA (mo5U34)-methyltransferase
MRSWYHTLDLPDGTTTPGYYDTRSSPRYVPLPADLSGRRCLDVGTFDGFWAFLMEKRRASEVVALDLADPEALDWPYDYRTKGPQEIRAWGSERRTGFSEAASKLGSSVKWVNQSVYDLDPDRNGVFDVVFCGALLLHLRDPVRALEAMRSVCRGSLLLAENIEPSLEVFARRVPAARLVLNIDQWWRANSAGLRAMTYRAGFDVVELGSRYLVPFGAGGEGIETSRLASLVAGKPREKGVLHRALRAVPRPPLDASS